MVWTVCVKKKVDYQQGLRVYVCDYYSKERKRKKRKGSKRTKRNEQVTPAPGDCTPDQQV